MNTNSQSTESKVALRPVPYRPKILYAGNFHLPRGNAAASRVIANARLLELTGASVSIVGFSAHDEIELSSLDELKGLRTHVQPLKPRLVQSPQYAVFATNLLRIIEEESPDIVILYNYPALASLRVLAHCRANRTLLVCDATEWYGEPGGPWAFSLAKRTDTAIRMQLTHRIADALITTSPVLTEYYARTAEHILELPTLFDTSVLELAKRPRPEVPRLVYSGIPFDFGRVKSDRSNVKDRLDRVVSHLATLADEGHKFCIHIYGVPRPEYLGVYPEHATILGEHADKFVFHGRVERSVVLRSASDADFSVFFRDPDRTVLAGFPTRLAESISAGTPVITSNTPNISGYLNVPGVFAAEPSQELSVLRALIKTSPQERMEMKRRAFESRKFDYRTYAQESQRFVSWALRKLNRSA